MQEGASLFGIVVAVIVLAFVLGAIIWGLSFAFGWFTAAPQGKLEARKEINSGSFRIQAYNQFFDKCASVTTLDQALQQTVENEKTDTGDDLTRDKINFTAQLNDRNDAANTYNADAHKNYTVGQFRDSNLPYSIPPYQKGEVFSCTD